MEQSRLIVCCVTGLSPIAIAANPTRYWTPCKEEMITEAAVCSAREVVGLTVTGGVGSGLSW